MSELGGVAPGASNDAHAAERAWHDAAPGPGLAATLAALSGSPMDPGPRATTPAETVDVLEGTELAALDPLAALEDYELVELVAAAQRLASWSHALAASAAGALAERESMQPTVSALVSKTLTPERIAGEEVAMRLGWTPRAGQHLVREGRQYRSHLMATGEALRCGDIDPIKSRVIRDALDEVPWQLAVGVQDMVLPTAPRRTPNQLANDIRSALVDLDPAEAAERRERAATRRYVSRPRPLPDGMAGLWLRTTALDAQVLYAAVDAGARAARQAGDARTLDQLRADLLVERSLHDAGCTDPLATPPWAGAGRSLVGPGAAGVDAAGGDPAGSDLAGSGLARSSTPRIGTPWAAGTGTVGRSSSQTHCRSAVRVDVRVLVPLATVVGTEDDPGHLDGYGTIDPEHARALARGGVWRRLVTDRISGTVLDVGRERYTPPTDMGELVRFRNLSCIHPGCTTSAWQCELDHTVPFRPGSSDGGPTAVHNLAPLSKDCHQIKTHGGFKVTRTPTGTYRWRTPTGHSYDVRVRSPIGSIDGRRPIFEHRHQLEELSPPRVDRQEPLRNNGDPPEDSHDPPGGSHDPPPF